MNKYKIHRLAEQGSRMLPYFYRCFAAAGIFPVLAVKLRDLGIPYSQTLADMWAADFLPCFNMASRGLVPKWIVLHKAESFSLIRCGLSIGFPK